MAERAPRLALEPYGAGTFLEEAVVAGGGVVVPLEEAEAMVWVDPHDAEGLAERLVRNGALGWVQLPFAGIEPMLGVIDRDRTWTAGQGVYSEPVAEHALALALGGLRHVAQYAREQSWTEPAGRCLLGASVTILGAGGIATSLVRLLGPFDCEVTVLRRRPEPMEGVARTGDLDELAGVLPGTDLLVLALALTAETTGIIDAAALDALPEHAWIVNVARGRHIVTDDLVAALRAGSIGGAALDVTDPEPLPDGHPLWSVSNCIITPHTANTPEMAIPVLGARITENVRRYRTDQPLLGVVDVDAGY